MATALQEAADEHYFPISEIALVDPRELVIEYGTFTVPPLKQQPIGHFLSDAQADKYQAFSNAIAMLALHGLLTDRERNAAYKRLSPLIYKDAHATHKSWAGWNGIGQRPDTMKDPK